MTMREIFDRIDSLKEETVIDVSMSYLEVSIEIHKNHDLEAILKIPAYLSLVEVNANVHSDEKI